MLKSSLRPSRLAAALSTLLAAAIPTAGLRADVTGFGSTGTGFTLNSTSAQNGPTVSNGTLTLTTGALQAHSAIDSTPQPVSGGFNVSFTYQESSLLTTGGGFAFVVEKDTRNATALGQSGTYLGYGGTTAISPSAAIEFNVAGTLNSTASVSSTNFATNGALTGGLNNLSAGANVGGGDNILVNLAYNGSTITETLTDTTTNGAPATYSYNVGNLAGTLGGSTAYVGFTGGTGALGSTQTISGFSFTSVPESGAWGPVVGGGLLVMATARMRRRTRIGV